jgi:hypothetical protein
LSDGQETPPQRLVPDCPLPRTPPTQNIPLYLMTGIGVSFSLYTAYRSSTTATDMVWDTTRRDLLDQNINKPAHVVHESEAYYNKGLLRRLAGVSGAASLACASRACYGGLRRGATELGLTRLLPLPCCRPQIRGYSHVLPDVGVPKGQHAHS